MRLVERVGIRKSDRGVWWAVVHGIPKSRTQLSNFFHFSSTYMLMYLPYLLEGPSNCSSFVFLSVFLSLVGLLQETRPS